jgi:hypothetical protein
MNRGHGNHGLVLALPVPIGFEKSEGIVRVHGTCQDVVIRAGNLRSRMDDQELKHDSERAGHANEPIRASRLLRHSPANWSSEANSGRWNRCGLAAFHVTPTAIVPKFSRIEESDNFRAAAFAGDEDLVYRTAQGAGPQMRFARSASSPADPARKHEPAREVVSRNSMGVSPDARRLLVPLRDGSESQHYEIDLATRKERRVRSLDNKQEGFIHETAARSPTWRTPILQKDREFHGSRRGKEELVGRDSFHLATRRVMAGRAHHHAACLTVL